jgi:hypothetical protein
MKLFVKIILLFILLIWIVPAPAQALPYIPGCPLHESCVRAYKQEQRQRQRDQRQRESPDTAWEEDEEGEGEEDDEGGEKKAVKKPLGFILGFQMDLGDWNNKRNDYINLRPSIAYLNGFGNFDIFVSAFYTLSLDDPGLSPVKKNEKLRTMSRGGIQANVGYTFDLSERFTLTPELDNQLQFDFTPDVNSFYSNGKTLSYAVMEPAIRVGCDVEIGDLTLTNSLPFAYTDDRALDYTISATFNALLGFGVTLSCQFWNLWVDPDSEYGQTNPAFQYGETELTLNYWRGAFFVSVTLTADGDFKKFSVEPYISYRIKKLSLYAGIIFNNLGDAGTYDEIRLNAIEGKRDVSGVIPFIGIKYRF